MTVGRTKNSDFTFRSDINMSGVHFVITYDSSECRLDDLNSTNGTYVNEQSVSQEILRHGDIILAGRTRFTIEHISRPLSTKPFVPSRPPTADESSMDANGEGESNSASADSLIRKSLRRVSEKANYARHKRNSSSDACIKKRESGVHQMQHTAPPACSRPPKLFCSDSSAEASKRTPAGVCLELMSEADERNVWLLPGQQLTVGRTEFSDFVISTDATLSGRHFVLRCEPDAIYVSDAKSTNGTFVNGNRISTARVFDRDVIQAGSMRFMVHGQSATARAETSHPNECELPVGISKTTLDSGLVAYKLDRKRVNESVIARALAANFHLHLIQHPTAKKRVPNPVYLYDWIPPRCAAQMSPVFLADVDKHDLPRMMKATLGGDSICYVFSDQEAPDLLPKLRLAVRGQHAENVTPNKNCILADTRPSALLNQLQQVDAQFAQYLFGAAKAFLLQSEDDGDWHVLTLDERLFEPSRDIGSRDSSLEIG